MIGAGGGIRTRTLLRGTNFKPVARVLTSLYYALPSNIYRCFSRQSTLTSGLVSARNPLIFLSSLDVIVHEALTRYSLEMRCTFSNAVHHYRFVQLVFLMRAIE